MTIGIGSHACKKSEVHRALKSFRAFCGPSPPVTEDIWSNLCRTLSQGLSISGAEMCSGDSFKFS